MSEDSGTDRLRRLIRTLAKLCESGENGAQAQRTELLETHISFVLLTRRHAFKFKKPLDLGFLDFTTLEQRRFFCNEELRLNRRTAPRIYLEVVTLTGTPETPQLNGAGEPIEYAVKMRRFDQAARLDNLLEDRRLLPAQMGPLGERIAQFHREVAVAGTDTPYATPDRIREAVTGNFSVIEPCIRNTAESAQLRGLRQWTETALATLDARFRERRSHGFVRECHGDLHLGNIALYEDAPLLFDCIEFSEVFRWIDVMSDIAFLVMDLDARKRRDLGNRLLNTYLEHTGDYEGLALLDFYCVYRALVRCKIAFIRLSQSGGETDAGESDRNQARAYLELAQTYTRGEKAALIITHGLSGSGKTTWTGPLLEQADAIRIRSDVERKRLFDLDAMARTRSGIDAGIYSGDATARTYTRLLELAEAVLAAGRTVIVDATFLDAAQRKRFRRLAGDLNLPFAIVSLQADETILRQRVRRRSEAGSDASEADIAVLERQIRGQQPLDETELRYTVTVDSAAMDPADLPRQLEHRLAVPDSGGPAR